VLYAAGVLKKEGKHVFCDNKAVFLTKKFKRANSLGERIKVSR